ncbi:MAG TPA: ABC transporter permease [Bryobacteraceae bacterium]|nr:ABC transporter permease [Bryobacteraceae bacterium]
MPVIKMLAFDTGATMFQDIRFALRTFLKSPGFTVVAILALGLGIGANAALFTVINTVLLKPLPYQQPERLVRVYETFLPKGFGSVSTPNFVDWRKQNHVFERLEAFSTGSINLQGDAQPERIPLSTGTAGMFEILGAKPLQGRTFLSDEDQPGKPDVAVISERLWRRRFSADPKLLGSTLTLDGKATTVIGIMPASFQFPPGSVTVDIWMPLQFSQNNLAQRGSHWMAVLGRLKPGVTLDGAAADMKQVAANLAQQYPGNQKGRSVLISSLQDVLVGGVRPALLVLMGSVGFVLLIACANVANLLLARAASRKKEVAVRAAMGASRARLIRQFLTESIMLALAGGVLGAFLGDEGVQALVYLASRQIPRATEVHLDGTVFLFLLGICLFAGIIFGLVPAFQSARDDLQEGLREGGRSGVGGRGAQFRNALVVTEFALALVLLIGAGLLLRTFLALNATDSGIVTRGVLVMSVSVPDGKYPNKSMWQRFYEPALNQIRELPGVRGAGMISLLPLQTWGTNGTFGIDNRPQGEPGHQPFAEYRVISPGYFQALGIAILKGRDVTSQDSASAPARIVINDALARRYFPGEDPIGHKIVWNGPCTIVGVAGNTRQAGLSADPLPELYFPAAQAGNGISGMTLVISTNVEPSSMTHAVESAIRTVDPSQPVFGVKTMERVITDSLSNQRLYAWLLGVFAGLALVLASAGIYGVMSYLVTQRTQEFGVRMALGASTGDVLRMVLRQALVLIALGVAIGLGGAFAVTRVLANFLFGVKPIDLATFAAVSAILIAVALIATYLPALRATKVDPMVALRYE